MDTGACPLCPRVTSSFMSSALATPPRRQAGLAPNSFSEMRKARLRREVGSHPEAVVDQKGTTGSVCTRPHTELGLDPSSSTPSSKRMKRTLNTSLTSFCILKAGSEFLAGGSQDRERGPRAQHRIRPSVGSQSDGSVFLRKGPISPSHPSPAENSGREGFLGLQV